MISISTSFATATERANWEPESGTRGTRRFIEYAKRFLSLTSSQDEEAFRHKLATALPDIDRVETIYAQYKRLLAQAHFSEKERVDFEFWMIDKCIFLGSKFYNHELIYEELPYLAASSEFKQVYQQFVQAITPVEYVPAARSYTILFAGQAGGGHKVPAFAIAAHLQKTGHKVQLIDIDLLESSTLPKVDGKSHAQIYEELYQREQNPLLAAQLSRFMHHMQPIQEKRFLGLAKSKITQFETEHIISCAHHRPDLGYLSFQLGIPMTVIHTDYIFQLRLLPLLVEQAKLKSRLIHFTTPTDELQFFERLFQELNVTDELPLNIMNQFQRLDFPVRDSFVLPTEDEIGAARKKFCIAPDALVCKIAMGQSGITKIIQALLQQLVVELQTTPVKLHLFVICGNNNGLRDALQATIKNSGKVFFDIRGFLDEDAMAQIDKISDVWVTKPGGSTCAELATLGKQMLYLLERDHPWERANALYLETLQLAAKLEIDRPLIRQLQERMAVYKTVDSSKITKTNWKKQINKIILK